MNKIIIKEHTIIEDLLLKDDISLIDLGACRGEFTDSISSRFSIGKAILVEPNVSNFNLLKSNPNHIILNKAVVGKSNGPILFKEDINSPYNGSLIFEYFSECKKYQIETVTISNLVEMMGNADYIDILKMDIEGAEYDVLSNTDDETLLKFKQITIEFHDFIDISLKEKNKEVEKRMINLGFSVEKKGIDYMLGSDYYDTLFYRI